MVRPRGATIAGLRVAARQAALSPQPRGESTIKVRSYGIIDRLYSALGLEPTPLVESRLRLDTLISPTLDIITALQEPSGATQNIDLTVTVGTHVVAHTVPDGEQWVISDIEQSGTNTASRIQTTINGLLQNWSAATTTNTFFHAMRLWLGPGDTIGMRATGDPADSSIGVSIHYLSLPSP